MDCRFRFGIALITLMLGHSFVGCSPEPPPPPPPPMQDQTPEYLDHKISYSGETLAVISRHYTGRSENWKLIAEANPGLRPERLRLGQVIHIPRAMVTNEAPLPKSAVVSALPKPTPSTDVLPDGTEVVPYDDVEPSSEAKYPTVPSVREQKPYGSNSDNVKSNAPTEPTDAERERLLEELLKQ